MLDILHEYLLTSTTPEEHLHIKLADKALVRAQKEDYEHVLEEIIELSNDDDSGETLQKIIGVYRYNLNYVLTLLSVTVTPDIKLDMLANIVEGILDIDNHENIPELLSVSHDEAPVLEVFCDMLSQTTRYTSEELLQVVEDISEGFIERLKNNDRVDEHEDENTLNERRERIHAFRKFEIYLSSVGASAQNVRDILHSGINPSMPYSLYAGMIDARDPIELMPAAKVARELYGAALISSDAFSTAGESVKTSLESYISNPQLIASVMIEVRNLMTGYQS